MSLHLNIESKAGIASGACIGFIKGLIHSIKVFGMLTFGGLIETAVYAAVAAAVGFVTTWLLRRLVKYLKSKFIQP
jgi:hypothetical protein